MNQVTKNVDLTSSSQKFLTWGIIASIIIFVVIPILNSITPSLEYFVKHLYITLPLLAVIVFTIFQPMVVYNMINTLVWQITKKWIGLTKVEQLHRFYDYIKGKVDNVEKTITVVGQQKQVAMRKIEERQTSFNRNAAQNKAKLAAMDKAILDKLKPRKDQLIAQQAALRELHAMLSDKAEELKYSTDALIDEYNTMKSLSGAADSANAVLGEDNSIEAKMYNEALNQLHDEAAMFAANVENFEYKVRPQLESHAAQEKADHEAGLRLIEEWKQKQQKLPSFKEIAHVK